MASTWWKKLQQNSLAKFGATVLIIFYLTVAFAELTAPYGPYEQQANGSLLPPTTVYWRDQTSGQFIGPHVYPATQGPVDIETGEREMMTDFSAPSPIRLWVKGSEYNLFQLKLPFVQSISFEDSMQLEEVELFPGITYDRHLFGTVGEGRWNIFGTDESARDQLSRLIHGGRISLSIGLVGIIITFPLGLLIGGISGYFGGTVDTV
ncbi:MAG: ABC transporter permease, partial [Cyanobacteria bacterium P01_D01_bin.2]